MTYKYIKIRKEREIYKIWNLVYEQWVGEIRGEKLFQYPNCGFSNGCIREISKSLTDIYGKEEIIAEYLDIQKYDEIYKIWDTELKKYVGEIRKERMGQWMHWQLFQYLDCGFTNGCLKAVSKFITPLYSKKKNEKR